MCLWPSWRRFVLVGLVAALSIALVPLGAAAGAHRVPEAAPADPVPVAVRAGQPVGTASPEAGAHERRPQPAGGPLPAAPSAPRAPRAPSADVIQDGSFEAGTPNPFWSESSTAFGSPICSVGLCGSGGGTAGPRTGSYWVWFGGTRAGG